MTSLPEYSTSMEKNVSQKMSHDAQCQEWDLMLFEVEIDRVRSGFECEFEDSTRIETESKNSDDSIRQ